MRYVALILVLFLTACGGANNAAEADQPTLPKRDRTKELARAKELHSQGKVLIEQNKMVEAIEVLEQAAEFAPDQWDIHANLAKALLAVRRNAEARMHYMDAAKFAPADKVPEFEGYAAFASRRMAHAAYLINEDIVALRHLQDALRLRPADGEANHLMGLVQHRRKEYVEAEAAFRLAADVLIGARRQEAMFWVGQTQFATERYAEAIATFTGLINEGMTADDIYGWRAYCYYQLGRNIEARRDYERATEFATSPEKKKEFLEAASKIVQGGG